MKNGSENHGPRVTLVQAPAFIAHAPPNALALLSAHFQRAGLNALVRDSSLAIRRHMPFEHLDDFSTTSQSQENILSRLLDDEARVIAADEPDIVGFSILTGTESCSIGLANRIKAIRPRTIIIFGGPQCLRETRAFDFINEPAVDVVALGEADRSLVEFAQAVRSARMTLPRLPGLLVRERAQIIDCGDPAEIENLDALPFMDFSGFEMERYPEEQLYISTSRGCVRRCAFCTHILQQKTYRLMSARRAVAEIRHQLERYPRRRYVEFGDSLVNGSVTRAAEMADLLVELRLERVARRHDDFGWGGMAILHRTMTGPLLKRMRRGGCQTLIYGLESGSQKVIDLMGKNFSVADAQTVISETKQAGITPGVFVMVGFPGETETDFDLTLDFLRSNARNIDFISTSMCDVQKGSRLDAHAADFGVALPIADRLSWRLRDGSNTLTIRQERHSRLIAHAQALGIKVNAKPTVRMVDPIPV